MHDYLRIKVKPPSQPPSLSFEDILANPAFKPDERTRLRAYTSHERRQRACYHGRRYLRHLDEDELHRRVGGLIANAVYVSARNRYSTNSLYGNYWQDRLAHTAEELVIRGSVTPVPADVLQHLPSLGFPVPRDSIFTKAGDPLAFYRYDKLRYLKTLRENGEIYLRCGSTEDLTTDAARHDPNELCIQLRLLADDLELTSTSPGLATPSWAKTIDLQIYQKTDYFMFCLSQVHDWRLFGDFNTGVSSSVADDRIGCLVITNPREFARRFESAATAFASKHASHFSHPLRCHARSATYYDACDAQECAPLFEKSLILPFAKRREFTYQHEFRYVMRPDVPEDFVPTFRPEDLPHFDRSLLKLGSLEDISTIIEPDGRPADTHPFYLPSKNLVFLSSAIGVTLPNSGNMIRFTYSVEIKEKGRTNPTNLTDPARYSGGSMGMHEKHIDVPAGGDSHMLHALRDFYSVFDVREHGNHLTAFEMHDPVHSLSCTYRAFLPCAEPADAKIQVQTITFEFEYAFRGRDGGELKGTEHVEVDGHTYMAQYNFVGPLHLHVTYRSLLIAEMSFIQRLIDRGIAALISYETKSRETGFRCSEFQNDRQPMRAISA